MWRRYGDRTFAGLAMGLFTLEAVAVGVLTWMLIANIAGFLPKAPIGRALLYTIVVTALALLVLSVYILAIHVVGQRRRARQDSRREQWTSRWLQVAYGQGDAPSGVPAVAIDAAIELLNDINGRRADSLRFVLRTCYDVPETLIARLHSRAVAERLEALEALAKARFPETLFPLLGAVVDGPPKVRLMGMRAAARVLSETPIAERSSAVLRFATALEESYLSGSAVEEVLQLLDDAASEVVSWLLSTRRHNVVMVRAAIDAAGKLGVHELVEEIGRRATHEDAEVRAAALRALASIGQVPPACHAAVIAATADRVEFVRLQALRAARWLPVSEALAAVAGRMMDESWWVRRAAASTLLAMGAEGRTTLEVVARHGDDRYARHIAAQVLADDAAAQVTA